MMIENKIDMDAQHLFVKQVSFFRWKGQKMEEFCHFNCKSLSSNVAKAITTGNDGM